MSMMLGPYWHGVFIVGVAYFVYALFRFGIGPAVAQAMGIVFLIAVMPEWMTILWSLGAECK